MWILYILLPIHRNIHTIHLHICCFLLYRRRAESIWCIGCFSKGVWYTGGRFAYIGRNRRRDRCWWGRGYRARWGSNFVKTSKVCKKDKRIYFSTHNLKSGHPIFQHNQMFCLYFCLFYELYSQIISYVKIVIMESDTNFCYIKGQPFWTDHRFYILWDNPWILLIKKW